MGTVASVIDERHFTVTNTTLYTKTETNIGLTLYQLVAPPLTRSGNVALAGQRVQHGQYQHANCSNAAGFADRV